MNHRAWLLQAQVWAFLLRESEVFMAIDRNVFPWFRRVAYVTFACIFLLAQPQHLFGQVDAGAIDGVVQDSSGAAVPNAKVTLLNTDQGITLETTTGSTGEYVFSPVRIGHYTLTVTAPGFSTTTQQNITVTVGQHVNAPVKLSLGSPSQTVQVTAAPPQLQSDEASVGQVINQHAVNSLPLNGRNFTFLAQLSAGVNPPLAATPPLAAFPLTASGQRKITTWWTASTTTPMRSTS